MANAVCGNGSTFEKEINTTKSINVESSFGNDFPLFVDLPQGDLNSQKKEAYFLAKKDFNLPSFWKKNPDIDGRGVVVGVIDDGLSPHAQGFKNTATESVEQIPPNSSQFSDIPSS